MKKKGSNLKHTTKTLAIRGGQPAVTIPMPHFSWRSPTQYQKETLKKYIDEQEPMSIYGGNGIYEQLEQNIEQVYQRKFCLLTNSGTSSLNSAYVGIGLNPQDEVIVPTYTFLATVTPLLRIGAKIIFADSCPDTGNIDPVDIEKKINTNTKALVITHMWGEPCDMKQICKLVKKYNLKLVEDCSHTHLTKYNEKLCGTFGDVACFSIGAQKTWTCGEGGFLITNDPEVYIRASLLGHFEKRVEHALTRIRSMGEESIANKYNHLKSGYGENYRMHPFAAVMAQAFFKTEIHQVIQYRRESLTYLTSCLNNIIGISPPALTENYFTGAMYGYKPSINLDTLGGIVSMEKIIEALQYENVAAKLPNFGALHNNPIFATENHFRNPSTPANQIQKEAFPGVAKYLETRLSLPTFSGGIDKDKDIIDQYSFAFKKVLSQSELLF